MSFFVSEFTDSLRISDDGNYVKMNNPGVPYVEIMFGVSSGMFKVVNVKTIEEGRIGIPSNIREYLGVSLNDEVIVVLHQTIEHYSTTVTIRVVEKIDDHLDNNVKADFNSLFIKKFSNNVLTPGVKYIFNVDDRSYKFKIVSPSNVDYMFASNLRFENDVIKSPVKKSITFRRSLGNQDLENLDNSAESSLNRILESLNILDDRLGKNENSKKNYPNDLKDIEDVDVGGLDDEINQIIRLVSLSGVLSEESKDMGIKTTKGILLYGPPGCGKTSLALHIAKKLKPRSCRLVEGPELNNKYIGETTKAIRRLFEPAEEDKKDGIEGLHVIIFDEGDILFGTRSEGNDCGSKHQNETSAQLLAKIQGINDLPNLLIIIMTNRKDAIDPALIRSGRIDTHIEIKKPNRDGRLAILKIVTKTMKHKEYLADDVNLETLADLTKNFTGADITTMISNAATRPMIDIVDIVTLKRINTDRPILKMSHIMDEFTQMNLTINPPVELSSELDIILSYVKDINIDDLTSDRRVKLNESIQSTNFYLDSNNIIQYYPHSVLFCGFYGSLMTLVGIYIKEMKDKFDRIVYISPEILINGKSVWSEFQYASVGEKSLIILNDVDLMLIDNSPFDKTSKEIMAIFSSVIKLNKKVVVIMISSDEECIKKYNLNKRCSTNIKIDKE